ncbi:MAG: glycosyltransferase family 2 protein [Candidatus Korobacteraceae bacterium]
MKTVTIIIPALHRPELTQRCIEFVQAQTLPRPEWEIVVVENEARSESILPDPLPENTTRIELPTNEGTTGSINRAVAATSSKYLLLLNNDIEMQPDYLELLVRSLDADPQLGFAAGKLLRATQRTHLDGAGDAMLIAGGAYRLGSGEEDRGQFEQPTPILTGCGAAVLYRRETFDLCGGLDADFFAYLDDIDLGLRAQLVGYGGMYVPQAVAFHIGSATTGAVVHPRILELVTRNQLWLLAKDYPPAIVERYLSRILLFQALWLAYVIRNRGLGAYLRGIRGAIAKRSLMHKKRDELRQKGIISDAAFEHLLIESERQVWAWHSARPAAAQSGLLKAYFRIFGTPSKFNN